VDIDEIITIIAKFLAYVGVAVIAYGGVVAITHTVLRGLRRENEPTIPHIRGEFARRIIFGLDFMIASDIVLTILAPSFDEVIRLGGIVLIRAVLTFILSKEMSDLRKEEQDTAGAARHAED
jgi:uncharacterized membrane protein